MSENKKIYLDNAATTATDQEVLQEMLPYFNEKFGNPMSVHSFGQEAMAAVDEAREKVANFFQCSPLEIIFTSGASESNNLSIKGSVRSFQLSHKDKDQKPHVITSSIEHHCVLDTCKSLEKDDLAEVTFLPVTEKGFINLGKLKEAIQPNTILISIMYVNNEVGTIQPIVEIGEFLQKLNQERLEQKLPKIFFHTDATQALNHLDCNIDKLGVDLLSFSGHKIYGPKGIGGLFIRKGTAIRRIQSGGDQEFKLRGGTHNVPGIVGVGAAIEKLSQDQNKSEKIIDLQNYLIERVLKEIPKSNLNGSRENLAPHIVNFRFDGVEGESLLLALDLEGIAVSTGSACAAGALDPSHVLLAMGLKHEQAHSSLRVSLGKNNTKEELDVFVEKLKKIIERLRRISGDVLKDFQ